MLIQFLLLVVQLIALFSGSVVAEDAGCPCLSSDAGALDSYKTGGQLHYDQHPYPNDYGEPLTHSLIHSFNQSFIHSLLDSLLDALLDTLTYSLAYPRTP